MPVFGLGKQRLDPHLTLAHGFLVGHRLVVGAHALQIGFCEMAMHPAPMVTGRTLRLEWAGVARRGIAAILGLLRGVLDVKPTQRLSLRADVDIALGVVGELAWP